MTLRRAAPRTTGGRAVGVPSPPFRRIRKRDGRLVAFQAGEITDAVARAAREVGRADHALAERVTLRVVEDLARRFGRRSPGVEDIQDAVEATLIAMGLPEVATAYIVYRRRRAETRQAKQVLGVRDELKLTVNAVTVLRERYLLKDPRGRVVESTGEMMRRVARHVAQAEPAAERERWEERFAAALASLELLPNSPTLMNAGTRLGLLSGCFVLPVEDSLDSIFTALRQMALIHQAGGGTGFAFSRLRPHGDVVASTHGVASGPVSFMTGRGSGSTRLAGGGGGVCPR